MKGFASLLLVLTSLLALGACHRDTTGHFTLLPTSTGKPGQVLVVAPVDISSHAVSDTLRAVLEREFPFLPQVEDCFDLTFVPTSHFDKMLHPFRNIILLKTPGSAPETESGLHDSARISVRYDNWSTPQIVVQIEGETLTQIAAFISDRAYDLEQILTQAERDRLLNNYAAHVDLDARRRISEKFDVALYIPKGYQLRTELEESVWYSLETPHTSQGVVVYRFPNRGDCFHPDTLRRHRDEVTRRLIPGPNEGTYMIVAPVVPPEVRSLRFGRDTLISARGFWEVYNHPMGGPFVSYSRLSPDRQTVITTDAYVYAPKFPKREYVREVEAILLSQVLTPPSLRKEVR